MVSPATALPYHEPDITTILTLSSLILLSNITSWALDRLVYCGLLGQIFLGIAWGTPGAKWLDAGVETAIVQFGYLGLILLVYEGGLSTSFQSLKANMLLSTAVAITGIGLPVGLSFILGRVVGATSLQSFAAGAALCSTSLGTTFTVLSTTGLLKTRLGVVLTSAAMLDDVVGLVMVQVISNLGSSDSEFNAITVIRPIFVSLAFAFISPLLCWLILKPMAIKLRYVRKKTPEGFLNKMMLRGDVAFILQTALLISMVTSSIYAGTSNLFAAYLAGAIVSWWDLELPRFFPSPSQQIQQASIGFSIPITRMFNGPIVCRGIVYSILMLLGKLLCGVWLIRSPIPRFSLLKRRKYVVWTSWWKQSGQATAPGRTDTQPSSQGTQQQKKVSHNSDQNSISAEAPSQARQENTSHPNTCGNAVLPPKPFSLYPGAILGLAMVSRGEIGFLISSLAESNGILFTQGNDEIFLVITWAIVICTLVGPLGVGLLVRRVRKLESTRKDQTGGRDVLGAWGVE